MLSPLRNPIYRHLFAAQLLSLLGTGLATVALGLLAFELAGADLLALGMAAGLLVLTPTGRLLRRAAEAGDRPAMFAAQFTPSHACWLPTYPLAGWLGAMGGIAGTFAVMAMLAGFGVATALALWPRSDPEGLEPQHLGLQFDHPHLGDDALALGAGRWRHRHAYVIDEGHPR